MRAAASKRLTRPPAENARRWSINPGPSYFSNDRFAPAPCSGTISSVPVLHPHQAFIISEKELIRAAYREEDKEAPVPRGGDRSSSCLPLQRGGLPRCFASQSPLGEGRRSMDKLEFTVRRARADKGDTLTRQPGSLQARVRVGISTSPVSPGPLRSPSKNSRLVKSHPPTFKQSSR